MSNTYDDWLAEAARSRDADGLTRRLVSRHADDRVIDLASNDYLGLTGDPRVTGAARAAIDEWGAGSTGSRLVTGSTSLHEHLENTLTTFLGGQDALVFSSGYTTNLGVIAALGGTDALVVSDADNHASVIDACRLARSRVIVTPHRDVNTIDEALASRTERRAVVVVDAVFSTDGEIADVEALHEVCQARDALLVIDEAHAVGVIGDTGRGLAASAGLADAPDVIRTVTLSKALGSQGGAVVGSRAVIDHIVNTARTFIFDTGLAPASAGAALAALRILAAEPELVRRVHSCRDDIARMLDVPPPTGAVVSLVLGDPSLTLRVAEECRESGVLVGCFRPPSVPADGSRLRMTARASLTDVEIKEATSVVADAIERLK